MRPPHDAIVILGGGFDNELPMAPWTQRRVETAADLFRQGAAPRVITSGRDSGAMVVTLEELGLPAEAILQETGSTTTDQNAALTRDRFLLPNAWFRPLIVTSRFHLARATFICREVLGPSFAPSFEGASDDGLGGPAFEQVLEQEEFLSMCLDLDLSD